MPQNNAKDKLYVVVISNIKERNLLYKLCVENNISITYPELFKQRKIHRLWGISKSGVGLVGTVIARHTPKDQLLHSEKELVTFFEEIIKNL